MKNIIITFILVLFVILVYMSGKQPVQKVSRPTQNLVSSSTEKLVSKPQAGWKQYQSERYGFSIDYPEGLIVKEFDEGGNASTITFQNIKESKGFQIFVVPFSGNEITDERFKKDVPSGVRTNTENITIDGASGAAFYSKDPILSQTREVWFIKNNFLYEVTTIREHEAWLLEIMNTWRFIK